MSTFNINTTAVDIPEINWSSNPTFIIFRGGAAFTMFIYNANNASNVNSVIQCNPSNMETITGRRIYIKVPVNIAVTGTNTGAGNIIQNGYCALRSNPIASIIQNLQININNSENSVNLNEILPVIMQYRHTYKNSNIDLSQSPQALDVYSNYATGIGFDNNPLNTYQNQFNVGRGGFPINTAVGTYSNTTTSANLPYMLCEPLRISPLLELGEKTGLVGINSLTFNITFCSNLSRILSYTNPANISNVNVNPTLGTVQILCEATTKSVADYIPGSQVYAYTKYSIYSTTYNQNIAAGATASITGPLVQLSSIPSAINIAVKQAAGNTNHYDSDSFLPIRNISVKCDTYDNQLSNFPVEALYKMNVDNGYMRDYQTFTGYSLPNFNNNTTYATIGGPLCLIPQKNIYFGDSFSVSNSLNVKTNFQATVTVQNQDSATAVAGDWSLFYIVEMSGVAIISSGECVFLSGILTRDDIEDASKNNRLTYDQVYGGNFFTDSWHKIVDLKNRIFDSKLYKKFAPMVKDMLRTSGPGSFAVDAIESIGGKRHKKKRY